MESVFIDPAMLMLQDEDIIEKNIDFFLQGNCVK